nr:solute carrier family 22 member 13-like isoform X2 [Nerophis lumbriciformis]
MWPRINSFRCQTMADFGAMLRHVGEFRTFQKLIICAVSFPTSILPFEFACLYFIQSDPERHCDTDWILKADANLTRQEQLNLTVPLEQDGSFSRCRMFAPVDWDIGTIRERGLYETTVCKNGWVYNSELYTATIVTDVWSQTSSSNSDGCKPHFYCRQCLVPQLPAFSALPVFDWRWLWRFSDECSYIRFLPESARWLLDRGRTEEAKELLLKVAAVNKRTVTDSLLEKIVVIEKTEKKSGVSILFQSSLLRKYFFIVSFAWFSVNVGFYCISFNVGTFGLDVFLTQLLFGLTEVPAQILCLWLLEVLGRRISIISTLLAGGLLSVLMLVVSPGYPVAVTALATSGRCLMNWVASICNVYVQELFPTSCRQTASGFGSVACRAGGLIAPLVNMLATYHRSIPIVIFSGLALISGALGFMLPETQGIELPDSTDDAEGNRRRPGKL